MSPGNQPFQVQFKASAKKALLSLPKHDRERVTMRAVNLASDPRPHDCKKLKGLDNLYLIRVGHYRIVYTIQDQQLLVLVVDVDHRKDINRP